ncbi:hypothetical protein [Kitasatospora azatica]|nr:hypothetical protein [Kitasatospora azatica]
MRAIIAALNALNALNALTASVPQACRQRACHCPTSGQRPR